MISSVLDFWKSMDISHFFGVLSISLFLLIVLIILNLGVYRRRLSQKLPGRKVRFLDLVGNFNDIPWNKEGRNGYAVNVLFLQVIDGYCSLFRKEQLICFWAMYMPVIAVKRAKAVEALIGGTKHMQKNWVYNLLQPWLGTGLLTSHGAKWKSRRKLLTPSFHFEILKDFLTVFNERSQVLVKRLQKEITEDFTDIRMPITLCSLDIICETALGVTIGAQENSDSQYVKSVSRATDILTERAVNYRYWIDFIFYLTKAGKELKSHFKVLHNFTLSVIQEKKKKLLSGETYSNVKRKRMAIMDLLLEHHLKTKDLSEEDIREEIDTFTFAGLDSTSVGMCWVLYLIGLHRDVQDKIHDELDEIFGDDVERPVNTDDLKDMKYLDRVLKESQRLYSTVPIIFRQASEDAVICGYPIPKGTSCMFLIQQLHKDEEVFPNPEKFDPDRFLPENCFNRHPMAYIPFSAGPRNCIGQRFAVMEMKTVLSSILRNYVIESLDPRDKIPPTVEIVQRSSVPIRIRIRKRQMPHLKHF